MFRAIVKFLVISFLVLLLLSLTACRKQEAVPLYATTDEEAKETSQTTETKPPENPNNIYFMDFGGTSLSFEYPKEMSLFENRSGKYITLTLSEEKVKELKAIYSFTLFYINSAEDVIKSADELITSFEWLSSRVDDFKKVSDEEREVAGFKTRELRYSYRMSLAVDKGGVTPTNVVDYFLILQGEGFTAALKYTSVGEDPTSYDAIYEGLVESMRMGPTGTATGDINRLPDEDYFDFLILGSDTRPEYHGKEWGRTDAMMILHLNPVDRSGFLVSIPRDTKVVLPEHGTNKINAAYAFGGEVLAIQAVEELTGIDIDNYAVVDFYGFVSLVDELGGMDYTFDAPLVDGYSYANFTQAGTFHLNGEQALSVVRSRHATARGDFDRVDRQKYFLKQFAQQKFNMKTLIQLPAILNILNRYGETDIDLLTLSKYAILAPSFVPIEFEAYTIPVQPGSENGVSYLIADPNAVRAFLEEKL
ncbi:MAG: LCP family protein [Actinobacteria bacterium]|nr:LCP family protein [Actinomycetota bacterium]